jgi:hypothetical protein
MYFVPSAASAIAFEAKCFMPPTRNVSYLPSLATLFPGSFFQPTLGRPTAVDGFEPIYDKARDGTFFDPSETLHTLTR